jgi:hypothetical protein
MKSEKIELADFSQNKIKCKIDKIYENLHSSSNLLALNSIKNPQTTHTQHRLISSKSNEKDYFMTLINNYQTKNKGIKTIANKVDHFASKEAFHRKPLDIKSKLKTMLTSKQGFKLDVSRNNYETDIKTKNIVKKLNLAGNSTTTGKTYATAGTYPKFQRNVASSLERTPGISDFHKPKELSNT